MDNKLALENLREVVLKMKDMSIEDRLLNYTVIITILDRIEEDHEGNIINWGTYRCELLTSCDRLCRLSHDDGHDDSQHICWALGAIDKLASYHCLKINSNT